MRKKIINQDVKKSTTTDSNWLDLEQLAQLEISSEDSSYPIEGAFSISGEEGWRASKAGTQNIRIIFDEPQQIRKIHLLFEEKQQARTQEFVLRWSAGIDQPYQEIVRQQYNFSPDSTTVEEENYSVKLEDVKIIELTINPDVQGGNVIASLARLWMA